jgi:two-component system, cell cycle sensor histidine kinase and response regulator CckA
MLQESGIWTTPNLLALAAFLLGLLLSSAVWVLLLRRVVRKQGNAVQREFEREVAALRRRQQLEKMDAIGKLAGGVAHSFNNYLTSILGYSELILETTPSTDPSRHGIEAIRKSAERGSEFTRQLFILNRRQALQLEVLSLNTVLSNMEQTLRGQIGEAIELRITSDGQLGSVKTDRSQMELVITHLVMNARDSLPNGGQITVSARNVDFSEPFILDFCELKPGPYVQLEIRDNGTGMDEALRQHAFEPFAMPKQKSKGSGLALALVYSMIQQNGGDISVTSEPGKGTTFRIFLTRL